MTPGFESVLYDPEKVVDKHTIAKYLPELACAARITDWQAKTPHCLCQHFITNFANDESVNASEVAKLARQCNVNLQNAYICSTSGSLAARFCALNGGKLLHEYRETARALAQPGPNLMTTPSVPVPTEFFDPSPPSQYDVAPSWRVPHHPSAQGGYTPRPFAYGHVVDPRVPMYGYGMDLNYGHGMDPTVATEWIGTTPMVACTDMVICTLECPIRTIALFHS